MSNRIARVHEIEESFNKAMEDDMNIVDGKVNWSFVEADVQMEAAEADLILPEDFMEIFDHLADEWVIAHERQLEREEQPDEVL